MSRAAKSLGKWPRASLWALAAAAGDLVSKAAALDRLPSWTPVEVVPGFFNLTLTHNTGAAFGLFSGPPGQGQALKLALLALASLAPLTWFLLKAKPGEKLFLAGLGLIYGGAAGNLHDRFRWGAVVDFLDFHWQGRHWPAFNLADVCVCIGAALVVLAVIRQRPGTSAEMFP